MAAHDWRPRDAALLPGFDAWRRGDLVRAETFFRERRDGGDADVLRGLGSVLWTRGRFEPARAAFATAIEIAPWDAVHWADLGLALRDLGRFHAALAALDAAVTLDPGYEPGWNEKANVLYDLGRPNEALSHYRQALSIHDGRAVVHHNLGMCLLALGDEAAALASFERALAIDPDYVWTRRMIAARRRS